MKEKTVKIRNRDFLTFGFPIQKKHLIAALFGLPVERYTRKIQEPVVIGGLIALFVAVHIVGSLYGLDQFVKAFGFIANDWGRNFFLTAVYAFFMHGSWMHLLGNSYYFYHFGDDVEHDLGLGLTAVLLFGAHFAGIGLEVLLGSHQDIPMIGASGGIAGILGYYMIRLPKRQISYMLFFFVVWIHVPVLMAFVWKFFWEMIIASTGLSVGVAHWAHLGGMLFGVTFALLMGPKANLRIQKGESQ